MQKEPEQTNKFPLNLWFVVVLNSDLFILINSKNFAKKILECPLRKTFIRKINDMTNTWNKKCLCLQSFIVCKFRCLLFLDGLISLQYSRYTNSILQRLLDLLVTYLVRGWFVFMATMLLSLNEEIWLFLSQKRDSLRKK